MAWPRPDMSPTRSSIHAGHLPMLLRISEALQVAMTKNGSPISTTLEVYKTGYGENTLVWRPLGMSYDAAWPAEHLVTIRLLFLMC